MVLRTAPLLIRIKWRLWVSQVMSIQAKSKYTTDNLPVDSKTLTSETRSTLLNTLSSDPENLAWSVRVVR